MIMRADEEDWERNERRVAWIYVVGSVLPTVISSGLEHYRWHVKRRDKQRKRDFYARMNKAIDKALSEREGHDE